MIEQAFNILNYYKHGKLEFESYAVKKLKAEEEWKIFKELENG